PLLSVDDLRSLGIPLGPAKRLHFACCQNARRGSAPPTLLSPDLPIQNTSRFPSFRKVSTQAWKSVSSTLLTKEAELASLDITRLIAHYFRDMWNESSLASAPLGFLLLPLFEAPIPRPITIAISEPLHIVLDQISSGMRYAAAIYGWKY